jgi:ribosomal protein S18 acetylase RimI-like enzyme
VPDPELLVAVTGDPADAGDAGELADLAADTFPLACPPELTTADVADFVANNLAPRNFRAYMADPEQHVFTATDTASGRIVGYMLLVDSEPDDSDVLAALPERPLTMVSKLYVLPGFHGRSVSTALMSAAFAHAAERGSARIWLGVNQQNLRAQRFYEKMGFAVVGRKTFVVNGKSCNDFVLARTPPQP